MLLPLLTWQSCVRLKRRVWAQASLILQITDPRHEVADLDKRYISDYLKNTGSILGAGMKKAAGFCAREAEQALKEAVAKASGKGAGSTGTDITGSGRKNYALITGASSGIGMEFARRLSLEGYPLILIARRRDRLEALRRELGTECLLLPADLARREDLIRLCEDLVGRRIDIFINNAGFGVSGPFKATEIAREVGMIDVNVTAQHVLFKYVLHRMEAEGGGAILNVASSAGLFPAGPYMAGYYATKAYMASLTRAVAEELRQAKSPVYVSCLCPGPVNTEFTARGLSIRSSMRLPMFPLRFPASPFRSVWIMPFERWNADRRSLFPDGRSVLRSLDSALSRPH